MAQTIGNLAIDIAAQTVGNINVNIAASAVTLNVAITSSAVTLAVDITAQSVGNLAVDLAAQTLGNLAVDIAAQTVGNLSVDLVAQTVGNLNIDIAECSVGNLSINIAAQAVDLNIKTSGGANIVIDVLTQAAYLERRSTLSNNGATPSYTDAIGNNRWGKFFPRGCRGFINTIDLWCRNLVDYEGTIYVYLSPFPGMGYVYTANITVEASGWPAWRSATFNKMWQYDSLCIFCYMSNANVDVGFDSGSPQDAWWTTNAGISWAASAYRIWMRAIYKGETIGDLPVSGTVNTIQIPSQSQARIYWANANLGTTETTLGTLDGAGRSVYFRFKAGVKTSSHSTIFRIYCDGTLVALWSFSDLSGWGYTADSDALALTLYAADGLCYAHCVLPFEFRRELKVTGQAVTTSGQDVYVEGWANLIR